LTEATHVYLVVSGGYVSIPEEHWQYGIRFALGSWVSAPADDGPLPTFVIDADSVNRTETDWTITSAWKTTIAAQNFQPDDWLNDQVAPAVFDNFGNGLWGDVRVDSVKASPITATGHVAEGRTSLLTWTSNHPLGSGSVNPLPLENSLAVSWNTTRPGPKGRGRIYYPVMSHTVTDAEGRCSTTQVNNTLAEVVAQIEAMVYQATGGGTLKIFPIVTGSPWSQYGKITEARVGNVIDTQRRRRRQTKEVYTGATVTW
jgi:hypothetical protein